MGPSRRGLVASLVVAIAGLSMFSIVTLAAGLRVDPSHTVRVADEDLEITGRNTSLLSSLRSYDETVVLTTEAEGIELDHTRFTCHGGLVHVTWYVGNLESRLPKSGIHLSVLIDDEVIGTILKGGNAGVWEDAPASIEAVTPCAEGSHTFHVEVHRVFGAWGVPYVANPGTRQPGYAVNRGFILTEVWR